jgi:hypothetical protein
MLDETPATSVPYCPRCHALQRTDARQCWLCGASVSAAPAIAGAGTVPLANQHVPIESVSGFSLASLMMFVTLVSVVLGLSTIVPGVGIPLGLILLVVWMRTAAVAGRRRQRGMLLTRSEILQTFISSLGVAVVLIILTCVAGCAAFVAACFSCAAAWNVGGQGMGTLMFVLVAAVIVITSLVGMGKWIHRRWRRDIGEPD